MMGAKQQAGAGATRPKAKPTAGAKVYVSYGGAKQQQKEPAPKKKGAKKATAAKQPKPAQPQQQLHQDQAPEPQQAQPQVAQQEQPKRSESGVRELSAAEAWAPEETGDGKPSPLEC